MEIRAFIVVLTLAGAHESPLEGPQNTLSVAGSNVTLKCSSPYRKCSGIDWQKYVRGSSPITISKTPRTILNVVDRDRYSVDNSSGCDLVIRNVQLKDAGRFICSIIFSSFKVAKSANLIILKTHPACTLNVSLNDTVEGDGVQLNCAVSFSGTNGSSLVWKEVADDPAAVKNGNTTINRTYSVVAYAPEVPSFTCEASFAFETDDNERFEGLATNSIPNANCSTSAITVFYSVRNVTLSPSFSNYPPGTEITCMAKGHPSPTFKWQENEDNGVWMDIQNQNGNVFTMRNVSSKRYRCFAMNVVRGKNHNATSYEFQVNNTDSLTTVEVTKFYSSFGSVRFEDDNGSFTDATTTPVNSLSTLTVPIAVGVGVGIVVLLLIILICCCVPRCLCYKCRHTEDKDGVVQHQDHEMSPSSRQLTAADRSLKTEAPIVGEQESAYAGLGEDRETNEYYASLEQRQKSTAREKVLDQESTYAGLGEDRDANEYASLEQGQQTKSKKKSKP